MLVWRIIATVIMGISCLTCLIKNINLYADTQHPENSGSIEIAIACIYGWIWRAFIIFVIWKL